MTLPTRLITAIAVLLALGAGVFAARSVAAQESIAVGDFFFCAASFSNSVCETAVAEGTTVTWTFGGSTSHTTTSDDEVWDSGNHSGGTFSFTFDTPGTYTYHCNIHPAQMRGRIVVEAPEPTVPEPTEPRVTAVVDLVAPATPTAGPGLPPTGQGGGTASASWWVVAGALAAGLGLTTLGVGYAAVRRRD